LIDEFARLIWSRRPAAALVVKGGILQQSECRIFQMKVKECTAERLLIRQGPNIISALLGLAMLGALFYVAGSQLSHRAGIVLSIAVTCATLLWILMVSPVLSVVLDLTQASGSVHLGSLLFRRRWGFALDDLQSAELVPDALWLIDPEGTLIRDLVPGLSHPAWEVEPAQRPALILSGGRKIPLAPPGLLPGRWVPSLDLINAWLQESRQGPPVRPTET
jgi:hypothetical protein